MAFICKQVNVSATTHVFSDKAKNIIERISHLSPDWITRYGAEALDLCPTLQVLCYTVTEQDCDYDYTTILSFMSKVTQLDILNAYLMRDALDDGLMCTPEFVMPTTPENIIRNVNVAQAKNPCVEQLQPATIKCEVPGVTPSTSNVPIPRSGGKKRTGKACAERSALKFRKMMNARQASEGRAAAIIRLFGDHCATYGYDSNGYPLPKKDVDNEAECPQSDHDTSSTMMVVNDIHEVDVKIKSVDAHISDVLEASRYPRFIVQCDLGCSIRHDGLIPFTKTTDSKILEVRHDFKMVVITHLPKPNVPVSYGYFTNDTMWRRTKPGIIFTDNLLYVNSSVSAFIYTDVLHASECYKLQMPNGRVVDVPITT